MFMYKTFQRDIISIVAFFITLLASINLGAMAITNITITNPSPVNINCGTCVTLTVNISYRYHGWEYLPQTGTLEIWENDWSFLDAEESIATASFTITLDDPQIGTKAVSVQVCCRQPDASGNCDFYGNAGTDDEHGRHEIYGKVRGKSTESPIVYAYCINAGQQASLHPDLPSYINTPGLDAVAFSGGRTTMHFGDIILFNYNNKPAIVTIGPYIIPASESYQGFIIPQETEIKVPAQDSVTFPLTGYCTDITLPPPPKGEEMIDINEWIGLEDAVPAPLPDTDPSSVSDAFEPRVSIDTSEIALTYPGTDIPFPFTIDINEHPEEAAMLIFEASRRIEASYDSLTKAGAISTPFADDPAKQESEVIQQATWIVTTLMTGDTVYNEAIFTERMEAQFADKAGMPIDSASTDMQERFQSGVEDFWSTFTTVGEGAKLLNVPDDSGTISEPEETGQEQKLKCRCDSIAFKYILKEIWSLDSPIVYTKSDDTIFRFNGKTQTRGVINLKKDKQWLGIMSGSCLTFEFGFDQNNLLYCSCLNLDNGQPTEEPDCDKIFKRTEYKKGYAMVSNQLSIEARTNHHFENFVPSDLEDYTKMIIDLIEENKKRELKEVAEKDQKLRREIRVASRNRNRAEVDRLNQELKKLWDEYKEAEEHFDERIKEENDKLKAEKKAVQELRKDYKEGWFKDPKYPGIKFYGTPIYIINNAKNFSIVFDIKGYCKGEACGDDKGGTECHLVLTINIP